MWQLTISWEGTPEISFSSSGITTSLARAKAISIRPDIGSYILLTFISCFALFCTRSNLLNKKGRGSNQSFIQGRGGQTLLRYLLFFLLLNDPQPPLTNAIEGLILLCLDSSIKLLIKFSCYLSNLLSNS